MPLDLLPDYLGGHVKLNHHAWLVECHKLVTNKASTCNSYYHFSANKSNSNSGNSSSNNSNNRNNSCSSQSTGNELSSLIGDSNNTRKRPHQDFIDIEEKKSKLLNQQQQQSSTTGAETNLASKIEPLPFNN